MMMNNPELDKFIHAVRRRDLPECPGTLESNVLRRVRLERRESESSFWGWMCGLNLRSGMAMAVLGLVVLSSSFMTAVSVSRQTARMDRSSEASKALDLAVFKGTGLIDFDKMEARND